MSDCIRVLILSKGMVVSRIPDLSVISNILTREYRENLDLTNGDDSSASTNKESLEHG